MTAWQGKFKHDLLLKGLMPPTPKRYIDYTFRTYRQELTSKTVNGLISVHNEMAISNDLNFNYSRRTLPQPQIVSTAVVHLLRVHFKIGLSYSLQQHDRPARRRWYTPKTLGQAIKQLLCNYARAVQHQMSCSFRKRPLLTGWDDEREQPTTMTTFGCFPYCPQIES